MIGLMTFSLFPIHLLVFLPVKFLNLCCCEPVDVVNKLHSYSFPISFTIQVLMWSRCVFWGCTAARPSRRWPTPAIQDTDWARQTRTSNSSLTQGSKVTSENLKIVWYVKSFLNFLICCLLFRGSRKYWSILLRKTLWNGFGIVSNT